MTIDQIAVRAAQDIADFYLPAWDKVECFPLIRDIIKAAIEKALNQTSEGEEAEIPMKRCRQCSKMFAQRSHNQRYCSNNCRYIAKARQRTQAR